MKYNLIKGNSLERLKDLESNSVDSIVTDPPYELGFMGKSWDKSGIAYNKELWQECLRVLKPGGHLLSFSGTRTYHRMTVAIEDAGFEIRDQIQWLYGSGFPKSTDISKQIDKLDAKDERMNRNLRFTEWMRSTGLSQNKTAELIINFAKNKETAKAMAQHYYSDKQQPAVPTRELFDLLKPHIAIDIPAWVEDLVNERTVESQNFKNREVIGTKTSGIANKEEINRHTIGASKSVEVDITKPSTPEAQKWHGWGTALKPANEPICVARKPFKTTVAENVLKYGVGAMNIDESRIETEDNLNGGAYSNGKKDLTKASSYATGVNAGTFEQPIGRWPANVIHDGLQEEWARYFYCAKASKKDRGENNNHPTVKPTDLMAYLVRLVTPPGGTVLDPFNGSGSTGKACARLGFNYIGIDLSQEYLDISKARIEHELNKKKDELF